MQKKFQKTEHEKSVKRSPDTANENEMRTFLNERQK